MLAGGFPLDGLLLLFYIDGELTVPSLYSGAAILACAAAALACAARERHDPEARRGWRSVAALTAYVAIDEVFALHERTVEPLRRALDITQGPLHHTWVLIAVPVLALALFALRGFILRLPPRTRRGVLASGAVFLLGAVGCEMLAADMMTRFASAQWSLDPRLIALQTLEEGLEMVGIALFLHALLSHLTRDGSELDVRLRVISRDR